MRSVQHSNRTTENFIKANREKAYSQHMKYSSSKVAEMFLSGINSNQRSPIRHAKEEYSDTDIMDEQEQLF